MVSAPSLVAEFLRDVAEIEQTEAAALLTIEQAAAESGYSAAHLRRLLATGQIPRSGGSHRPRIRRGDLPLKASRGDTFAHGGAGQE